MTPLLVLINVGQSLAPAYAQALGGTETLVLNRGAGSASYDERTGLAAEYPSLRALLSARAPSWMPGRPLVLVAFSAGVWALRAWLLDPEARGLASAVVLLDGLHSGLSAGQCDRGAIDGVIQYAWNCIQSPSLHLLVVTHTAIVPPGYASTTQCAALLPPGPGVWVLGYPGADAAAHNQQQREVGPAVLASLVRPWVQEAPGTAAGVALVVALVVLGLALLTGDS